MEIQSICTGGAAPYTHHNGEAGRELVLGESLDLRVTGGRLESVTVREAPEGEAPTLEGSRITPRAIGRHWFVVSSTDGSQHDVRVMVCDAGVLARIVGMTREPRKVLRSLSAHADFFDGTDASLVNQPLQQFGA